MRFAALALLAAAPMASAQQAKCVLPEVRAPLTVLRIEREVLAAAAPAPAVNPEFVKAPEVSPNTGMPRFDTSQGGHNIGIPDLAIESSQYIDPRYIANSQFPDQMGGWEQLVKYYGDQSHRLVQDFKNFYLSEDLLCLGLAVGIAAPLANTNADHEIGNWYQRGAGPGHSNAADQTANAFHACGEWGYTVPIFAACSITGFIWDDNAALQTVGDFGNRSLRALAVGTPAVGILSYGLGSGSPGEPPDSRWQPLHSEHGVSSNAFVGAVPFLTAASMTDSVALKSLFIAGSIGPAWADFHNDNHYLSQVFLGWAIAYLAVDSVSQTESERHFHIVPCDIPKGIGVGVELQY